ncbi:cobalt ECF transporter T component CbiQ [Thermococcus sp.]|uniref:cobalt ECF transporter T component CbiQ n=1 Tax=Thermococcus sp. TaxID=35749 RepID=UPI0026027609|nr:cobalt ECF transporter T component CbiQ [Thermococcus sp.]
MGFLEETTREILEFTTEAVFSERYARKEGLLQKLDPRLKIASLIILVTTVVSLRDIGVIVAFYFLALALAVLSRLPVLEFTKRVWVFIPIFTGIIAVPSVFMLPGESAFRVFGLTATWEGIRWAVLFTMRVAAAVSYAVLFTMTSRWNEIISALASFRVPGMVITIATLAYRYVFLLAKLLLDAMHARRARLAGELGMMESWREAGKHIGATFIKANALGEELYYAMVSRGYVNEVQPLGEFRFKGIDYAFSALTALIVLLTLAFTRGLP